VGDQRLVIGLLSTCRGSLRARDNQGRFQRFDVVWQGFNTSFHEADGITKSAICGDFFPHPRTFLSLALQLPFLKISESMGNHDSKIVDADSVD
jgi:hypothetical protein